MKHLIEHLRYFGSKLKLARSFIIILFLFSFNKITAQSTYQIEGNLIDNTGKSIAFANILLLKANDSTLIKGEITKEDGSYSISKVATGDYFIRASLIGYQNTESETFKLVGDYRLNPLVLIEGEALSEVVLTSEKPLFTQKVDRLVINVESSIVSAGGTALEVLERSPGVNINRQSNAISIVGKEGVVVMINDKISYMPSSALVQMLEGMSADNISSIELITTPPANFDAEGNAGYINIVLKKRTYLGLNGSYSVAIGYGKGVTNNDNLNFNYRKKSINLYGSYGFSLDERAQVFTTSREFTESGNLLASNTVTDRDPTQRNHNLRLGLDINTSDKTIMGVLLSTFDNRWSMDAINNSFDSENGIPTSYVILDNDEVNHLKHIGNAARNLGK